MPYRDPKQAVAAFLDIKRREGLNAAKEFGRKHREDMAKGARASHGQRPYRSRRKKS